MPSGTPLKQEPCFSSLSPLVTSPLGFWHLLLYYKELVIPLPAPDLPGALSTFSHKPTVCGSHHDVSSQAHWLAYTRLNINVSNEWINYWINTYICMNELQTEQASSPGIHRLILGFYSLLTFHACIIIQNYPTAHCPSYTLAGEIDNDR